jgi:hypothetical protein
VENNRLIDLEELALRVQEHLDLNLHHLTFPEVVKLLLDAIEDKKFDYEDARNEIAHLREEIEHLQSGKPDWMR